MLTTSASTCLQHSRNHFRAQHTEMGSKVGPYVASILPPGFLWLQGGSSCNLRPTLLPNYVGLLEHARGLGVILGDEQLANDKDDSVMPVCASFFHACLPPVRHRQCRRLRPNVGHLALGAAAKDFFPPSVCRVISKNFSSFVRALVSRGDYT